MGHLKEYYISTTNINYTCGCLFMIGLVERLIVLNITYFYFFYGNVFQ